MARIPRCFGFIPSCCRVSFDCWSGGGGGGGGGGVRTRGVFWKRVLCYKLKLGEHFCQHLDQLHPGERFSRNISHLFWVGNSEASPSLQEPLPRALQIPCMVVGVRRERCEVVILPTCRPVTNVHTRRSLSEILPYTVLLYHVRTIPYTVHTMRGIGFKQWTSPISALLWLERATDISIFTTTSVVFSIVPCVSSIVTLQEASSSQDATYGPRALGLSPQYATAISFLLQSTLT